jgi:transaldolase
VTETISRLAAEGVAIWLDDLSRARLISGDLARMVETGEIVGVTTNPTIFSKSISGGSGYEDQLRDLALRGVAAAEALRLLTAWDVRAACDVLHPVFARTGTRDGRVSIEVDPRISGDAERTAAEARGLWWLVDRPNLFIKIPATQAALPAITESIADGISVNVTLIFSLDRYRAVLDAFLTGLERRAAAGEDLVGIESVASFFVSRVDTEVDKRLADLPSALSLDAKAALHGTAALANARLAYEIYEETAASQRWKDLAGQGASLQRLLWASTGVKDKAFAPTRYVTELVARDTVNTVPEATLRAVASMDEPTPNTISHRYEESRATIAELAAHGVDLSAVADALERDGLRSFVKSWDELVVSVEDKLKNAGQVVTSIGAGKTSEEHEPSFRS